MRKPTFDFGRVPLLPPAATGDRQTTTSTIGLDSCARLSWDRQGRLGSYRACGYLGALAGLALVVWCGRATASPPALVITVLLSVPASFLFGAWASRFVHGVERIVFFEQALFVSAACALGAAAVTSRAEVPTAVDLATIGIGTFLAFGRVGCLMVGCCHGRPARWGIRYGAAHAEAGFPWYLVGRRLFPLQLIDGTVSAVLVATMVSLATHPHPPGALAAGYYLAYCPLRFVIERFRGDATRPRRLGLSEAQWTATLLAASIAVWAAAASPREARPAAVIAAALALAAMATSVLARRPGRGLADPWHLDEIQSALVTLARSDGPRVTTSRGLRISRHGVTGTPGAIDYVLSLTAGRLAFTEAQALARVLTFSSPSTSASSRVELRAGAAPGLFHVVVTD